MKKLKDALKANKKGKKKKIVLIVVIILVVVVTAIVLKVRAGMSAASSMMASADSLGTVEVRDLTQSIGATGTVVSMESKSITSTLTNTEIAAVNVKVGDSVKEGDELVTFDTTDIEEKLADAQTSSSLDAADSQRNVDDTLRNSSYQIESAQSSVDSAYLSYCQAKTAYEEAAAKKAQYDAGDKTLEQYSNIDNYYVQYMNAKSQYESAQKQYDNTVASQASSIASAYSNQQKTSLQDSSSTDTYEEQLENATITAPFDGVITAINVEEGDTYSSGTILTIQDCSSYQIEASIGEYDISDVAVGEEVLIKTDATGDDELEGTVTFVSPVSTSSSSSSDSTTTMSSSSSDVSYQIKISVDTQDDRLRLDMSASLSIIVAQHENVLTVPYNAVQTDSDGNTYVEVLDDSQEAMPEGSTEMEVGESGDDASTDSAAESSGQSGSAPSGGAPSGGGPSGGGPSGGGMMGGSGLMSFFTSSSSSSTTDSANAVSTATYKKIPVTVVLESNYYTEVSADELEEGMQVRLVSTSDSSSDGDMMMMDGGGMGGF